MDKNIWYNAVLGNYMSKFIDITGNRYGKVIVKEFAYINNHNTYWKVTCDCKKDKIVQAGGLRNGTIQSCGCSRRKPKTHGQTSRTIGITTEYRTWQNMKNRC